jgi:hypothetical protein
LDDEPQVYSIKIRTIDKPTQDREKIMVYGCDIRSEDRIIGCELRYYIDKTTWILYRI